MSHLIETGSNNEGLDSGGLREILSLCRLDLDGLRKDGDGHSAWTRQGGLDRRLCRVVERLERTAGTLDAMLDRVAGRPATAAAAEVLAREADHRIKNSLQTVVAMLDQQARRGRYGPGARRPATGGSARGGSGAGACRAACRPCPYGIIPELGLDSYLGRLCATLEQAMGVDGERRSLRVDVEPLAVSPGTAQKLGLLVTELVTNALRHAFRPGRPGAVRVTGTRQGDGSYKLCIVDNGRGLPRDFDLRKRPSGLGLRLASVLADQLQARLTVDGQAGARFTLALPASVAGCGEE